MAPKPGSKDGIHATRTTFAIVETICELKTARLTEIADETGIAYSTAHEHLSTLEDFGYVVKEDGSYRLGLKLLDQGMQAKMHYRDLTQTAKPVLEQLTDETDEAVNLLVEEHDLGMYLIRLTGKRGIPTNAWPGKQTKLHCNAAGKAILAHYTEDRLAEIVDHRGLSQVTDNTITDQDALISELESIRERGVSFNDRESQDRVRAVGAPIVLDDRVMGAVSVTGPANRFKGSYFREEMPDLLLGVVNEIELRLTHQ